MTDAAAADRLAALARQVARELDLTAHPDLDWMPRRTTRDGRPLVDVLVVGAGQGGIATAFQLRRERVTNSLVIDRTTPGREGPWRTYARMRTLRSPKQVTGPDLGVPALTYQAWHEARFGAADWAAVDKIPSGLWADYLDWVRETLDLPVRHGTELVRIDPADGHLDAVIRDAAGERVLPVRKIVLVTGQDGTGRWWMPPEIEALPAGLRCAASEAIDFAALAGRRVAVIGGNATAFDNAAVALENGAAAAHVLVRRPQLQRVQPYRWLTFAGFLRHYADLDDAWRWRFMSHILGLREGLPGETYHRVIGAPRFHLHLGAPVTRAAMDGDAVRLETPAGAVTVDFVICGTGMDCDLARRPELASFAGEVALWADRYTPPPEERNDRLARYPYLGDDHAFQEKVPGRAPFLADIHDFTFGATMSFGVSAASINAMKISVPRLVAGVTRGLFRADAALHLESLRAYDVKQFRLPGDPD